jgi:cytochrome b561
MPTRNDSEHWGTISIALHWLTFVIVFAVSIVGLLMTEMGSSMFKVQVYTQHKNFGLLVLALTALRLLWRLVARAPEPVANTPAWQEWSARATHGALYLLLLLVPLSGWWFNSAAGFALPWFGLVKLPALAAFDAQTKALARETHETLFYVLAALVAVHAMAALWHHYRVKDRTLVRMLPALETSKET